MSDADGTDSGSTIESDHDPGRIDTDEVALTSLEPARVGEHESPDADDQLGILGGDIQPHEFDDDVVLKQLSEYKYESVESMIREYVTNAVATTLETQRYLGDGYSPLVHIAYYPTENRLIIEDNGMGLGEKGVETGRKGGLTTHWFDGKLPGKFGIGRFAAFTATGLDGCYFVESRSRVTGEHIKGAEVADGFNEDEDDRLPTHFGEDRYGTRFEFPLKPEHSDADIHAFVRNKAFHTRVPVLYTEHNSDGTEDFAEEYGGKYFTSEADAERTVIYEDEYVRAVHGSKRTDCIHDDTNRRTDTVQLDTPIDRNHRGNLTSVMGRWTFVFLKTENARVVEGPHEGLIRITDSEYEDLTEEEREEYVPASACTEDDIWMPTPAGDRDRLKTNDRYWEWLGDRVTERANERINRCLRTAVNGDPLTLDESSLVFMSHYVGDVLMSMRTNLEEEIGRRTLTAPDEEKLKTLEWIFDGTVELCVRGEDPRYQENRKKVPTWRAFDELSPDGDGFVTIRPSTEKARIVWEDDEANVVIRIKKSDQYDFFEDYGFRKLKEITADDAGEFDVPAELTQQLERTTPSRNNPNAGRDPSERHISVHNTYRERTRKQTTSSTAGYDWKRTTETVVTEDVLKHLEWTNDPDAGVEYRDPYRNPGKYRSYKSVEHTDSVTDIETDYDEIPLFPTIRRLVVFKNTSDRNISEYYNSLAVGHTAVAKCTQSAIDYLTRSPHVITFDEALQEADRSLMTVDGESSFRTVCEEYRRVVLHYLPAESVDVFRVQVTCKRAGAATIQQVATDRLRPMAPDREDTPTDVAYVPVSADDLDAIGVLLDEYSDTVDFTAIDNDENDVRHPHLGLIRRVFDSNTSLYAYASLREWGGSTLHDLVTGAEKPLREGGRELIDCLADRHDRGLPPRKDGVVGTTDGGGGGAS